MATMLAPVGAISADFSPARHSSSSSTSLGVTTCVRFRIASSSHSQLLRRSHLIVPACSVAAVLALRSRARRRDSGRLTSALRRRAARIEESSSVYCSGAAEADTPPACSDALVELGFLIADPLNRRLNISTRAIAVLPSVDVDSCWRCLVAGDGFLDLQPVGCYGVPLPLISIEGSLEEGSQVIGQLGVADYPLRKFIWTVNKASVTNGVASLILEGKADGEPDGVTHSINIRETSIGCEVSSEVAYSPSPPLQTFLNAVGGRQSVTDGNKEFLRRLGVVAGGDLDFNPVTFYNTLGPGIDLMAPLEDEARFVLADRIGLILSESSLDVLEIGCGTGRWAEGLIAGGAIGRYVGVDSSSTMCYNAASRLSSADIDATCRVVGADARQEGVLKDACKRYFDDTPDMILCAYVLDLFDDRDLDKVLAECRELLTGSDGQLGVCSICSGSPVMEAWEAIWKANPGLVGGCRPIDLSTRLKNSGWSVTVDERVDAFGYLSQILVAKPGGPILESVAVAGGA